MFKVTVNNRDFNIQSGPAGQSIDGKVFEADMLEYKEGKFHILRNHQSYSAEILAINNKEKTVVLKVNNHLYTVVMKDKYDDLLRELGIDLADSIKVNDIKAPMPGMVLRVLVSDGQPINKGDAILVLEAMKMENILKSPSDGIVKKIHVAKGDKVEKNQVMVNLV